MFLASKNLGVKCLSVKCHFLDDQDKPVDIADIEVNYEDARNAIKDGLIGLNLTLSPRVSVPKLHCLIWSLVLYRMVLFMVKAITIILELKKLICWP